jgi:hypothetical protein
MHAHGKSYVLSIGFVGQRKVLNTLCSIATKVLEDLLPPLLKASKDHPEKSLSILDVGADGSI